MDNSKIRIHLPAIPYTITRSEYSHDAYTGKVMRLSPMMISRGFEVYHYGVETSESGATKNFDLMTKAEWTELRIKSLQYVDASLSYDDAKKKNDNPEMVISTLSNWSSPLAKEFNKRLREKLKENYRSKSTDIVCMPLGRMHEDAVNKMDFITVESGIGYSDSYLNYRIFESYAWMSRTLGSEDKQPNNYWFVIPNYFDTNEFKFSMNPTAKKIGFLGRITSVKGCGIMVEIAKRFPHVDFVLCGQGDYKPFLGLPNVQYKLPIHGEERSEYLGSCVAVLCLSKFLEPFCGTAVEAQLCGTPVISSDWGGMAETVEQGKTGLKGHTLADYCHGVQMALDGKFNRQYIRERAVRLYDMYNLALNYEYVFKSILDIHTPGKNGWYSPDAHIKSLLDNSISNTNEEPIIPRMQSHSKNSKIRIHLPAIPYTITRSEYSHDAFTNKVKQFSPMMISRGFEVYHYGVETSESGATKNFDLMTKAEWNQLRIETLMFIDPKLTVEEATKKNDNPEMVISTLSNWSSPLTKEFNKRLREKLIENYRSNQTDIVCIPLSKTYKDALDKLNYVVIETGIGYEGSYMDFRIFESYAWMSRALGHEKKQPNNYWFVIPHAFNTSEFKLSLLPSVKSKPPRVGYMGRITLLKGCVIIAEVAKQFPHVEFVLCGQGDPKPFLVNPNILYKPPIHGEERSEFLGSCIAFIHPAKYLEPFGCGPVEAQLCGTPVISSDWGGMGETVEQGKTGLRCHTLADYCYGVQMALDGKFDRQYIRDRAVRLYDMYNLSLKYEYVFNSILDITRPGKGGWYSPDTHILPLMNSITGLEVDSIQYTVVNNPPKQRIYIFIVYYGAFPNYFQLFLDSLGINTDILSVFLVTDIDLSPYKVPENLIYIKMAMQNVKERISRVLFKTYGKHVYTEDLIKSNYKFVDFKIIYPLLFDDYLQKYNVTEKDYVGWGDCDLIYGKMSNFINFKENYGIFGGWHGHFVAIQNTDSFKNNFTKIPNYFDLVTDNSKTFITDEIAYREPLKKYLSDNKIKMFYANAYFCDIAPACFFHMSRPDHAKYEKNFYDIYHTKENINYLYYDKVNPKLTVVYDNGDTREALYCHLQKRKMDLPFTSYDSGYYINENSFSLPVNKIEEPSSYSQLGQDTDVINFYKNKSNGYFIEIGAYDGIKLSNTYLLEKKYNWKGICVDALPNIFDTLKKNRPNSICSNKLIYSKSRLNVQFDICNKDKSFSGISDLIITHKNYVDKSKDTVLIETLSLMDLLCKYNAPSFIEYLSLGIEGGELEALNTLDFNKYTFGLINIKHNYLEPLRTNIRKLLTSNSYVHVKENKWVDYYKHSSVSKHIHRNNVCPVLYKLINSMTSKKGSIILSHRLDNRPIYNNNAFNVFISSEPEEPSNLKYDMYILAFVTSIPKAIYYPFLYMALAEMRCKEFTRVSKTKFCAFMYFKDYKHRNDIFDKISKFKHIDAIGKACNNKVLEDTRYVYSEDETFYDIAVKLYSEYNFVLSIENSWKEGYFTEKILNPILAHSIPLYWGHPKVFEYINKKRVIYLPDYTDYNELFTYLQNLMDNNDAYDAILNEQIYTIKGNPSMVNDNFLTNLMEAGLEKSNAHMNIPVIYYHDKSRIFCEQQWLESIIGKKFVFYKHTDILDFDKDTSVILIYQGGINIKLIEQWLESNTNLRPFLFHISDEFCTNDISIYNNKGIIKVFRNYWRPDAVSPKVIHLPLGYYKSNKKPIKPLSDRLYTWSFAGAMDRPYRKEILSMLETLQLTSRIHKTPTFGSSVNLSEEDYLQLLLDTKLVPCLPGYANVECFRFYEALECGAVPIISIDDKKSYLNILNGTDIPPLLGFSEKSWANIKDIADNSEILISKNALLQKWWIEYKEFLKTMIQDIIR